MSRLRVGTDRPTADGFEVTRRQKPRGHGKFMPLPSPTGKHPYRMSLSEIVPQQVMKRVESSGKLVLHMLGDTGGIKYGVPQVIVAKQMEMQLSTPKEEDSPALMYHLGDVVYFYGASEEYFGQFYDPYEYYTRPIVAIPGNHDGAVEDDDTPSLRAFVRNFCAETPHITREAGDIERDAMTQPNCYFTLNTPVATFIGLYTNVPEGGEVRADQRAWFVEELKQAPKDRALIVALHHPPLSMDSNHGGSLAMRSLLDGAFADAKRFPHAVFAAHVHNYQRFTRRYPGGREVPYIVAGNGGYHNLHRVPKGPDGQPLDTPLELPFANARLDGYVDDRHGFLRLTITRKKLRGEFFPCPRPHESWSQPAKRYDVFEVDLKKHGIEPSELHR